MKKVMLFSLMVTFIASFGFAQGKSTPVDDIYKKAEVMPEYPGGQTELMAFFGTVEFPKGATEGAVYVSFVVEKDGTVSNVTAVKSSGIEALDETAIAHVRQMPQWTPGYQDGKAVRVQYVVPFKFKLS